MKNLAPVFSIFLFVLLGGCAEDTDITPSSESPEVAAARELVAELPGRGITMRNPDGTTKTVAGGSYSVNVGEGEQIILTDGGINCDEENGYVGFGPEHTFITMIGLLPGGKHYAHSTYYKLDPGEYVINGLCYLDVSDPRYGYDPATGQVDEEEAAAGCREVLARYPSSLTIVDWNDEVISGTITALFHKDPSTGGAVTTPTVGVDDLVEFGEITIVFNVAAPIRCE